MHVPSYLAEVERFTREELVPNEDRLESLGHVPEDIVRRLRDAGLFAIRPSRWMRGCPA